ncbi:helix-turn-helix domain-containing protein [Jatrophihabitans telluris]|uniref:Helix-turn-helix domain-containing protein n=1 Tax=Jatrophihabitans telluris TaxID=2038343 RepID=A0ABY4R1Q4_9ACTN|nr:winged helix-turn-helix domain-containing protein [Jatrophihabitans telluris]UQX89665.1 helix-turn-helix domain-containing protein [Jatrophihabitans telluris]
MLTDPRAIKALAHPARLAVIDEFFSGRRLTATECAEIAGLSASAMSYHLRALEKWGIIRRSEATDDGRERPWEAAGSGLRIQSTEPHASIAGETLLIDRILDRQRSEIQAWLNADDSVRGDWDDAMTIAGTGFYLTLPETLAVTKALQAELDKFDRRADEDLPEGVRQVRINITVVPTERTAPERTSAEPA